MLEIRLLLAKYSKFKGICSQENIYLSAQLSMLAQLLQFWKTCRRSRGSNFQFLAQPLHNDVFDEGIKASKRVNVFKIRLN
jgi:hypothetical protein